MAPIELRITEYNEAGDLVASYISSSSSQKKELTTGDGGGRVDIIRPEAEISKSIWQTLLDVFLPAGYPHSVTEDYAPYQIYDSLQAFTSSIAHMLSSRAVLEGVGVGDASASPTAALLLSVIQESAGRLATILFAHKLGTSLEPECKMYRLSADFFNDAAKILDCVSPIFPKPIRVLVLSASSVFSALCGVAAGSSKASLSAHFAKWGNLGELNAKDSSQETIISLLGMLVSEFYGIRSIRNPRSLTPHQAGSLVVSWISAPITTWLTLLFLLGTHLFLNYSAVRSVSMRSLNRQRANIVFAHLLAFDKLLSPQEVSKRERIFEWNGVLRLEHDRVVGYGKIGVCLETLLSQGGFGRSHKRTRSVHLEATTQFSTLLDTFEKEFYILWFDVKTSTAYITLKEDATVRTQLKAWLHGLLLARGSGERSTSSLSAKRNISQELVETLKRTSDLFNEYEHRLITGGWDLDIAALETHSGTRLRVQQSDNGGENLIQQ